MSGTGRGRRASISRSGWQNPWSSGSRIITGRAAGSPVPGTTETAEAVPETADTAGAATSKGWISSISERR